MPCSSSGRTPAFRSGKEGSTPSQGTRVLIRLTYPHKIVRICLVMRRVSHPDCLSGERGSSPLRGALLREWIEKGRQIGSTPIQGRSSRGVAKPGIALGLEPRDRGIEARRPDSKRKKDHGSILFSARLRLGYTRCGHERRGRPPKPAEAGQGATRPLDPP